MTGISETELRNWMNHVLRNEDIHDFVIQTTGSTEKGEGRVGDIIFLTVSGTTRKNEPKIFNFVVKHGKKSEAVRKTTPFRDMFITEIAVYDKLLPRYLEFQKQRKVKRVFDAYPKCYGTLLQDSMEVIVLENMKSRAYEVHDRFTPMDMQHVELVLKEYGSLHGISWAFKDQHNQEYLELTSLLRDGIQQFSKTAKMPENCQQVLMDTYSYLKENGHACEKIEKFIPEVANLLSKLYENNEEPYSIIKHGDGWNSNFMFKYKNGEEKIPETLCILDWQGTYSGSPVYDLSYFIFTCCEAKQLDDIDKLLRIYHKALSATILELGSDPEKLFPFSKLREHWRKYGKFGVIVGTIVLKFMLFDKEEAQDFGENIEKGQDFNEMLQFQGTNLRRFHDRILSMLTHSTILDLLNFL